MLLLRTRQPAADTRVATHCTLQLHSTPSIAFMCRTEQVQLYSLHAAVTPPVMKLRSSDSYFFIVLSDLLLQPFKARSR